MFLKVEKLMKDTNKKKGNMENYHNKRELVNIN